MKVYSKWCDEDVANLLPPIKNDLANPSNIDPHALQTKLLTFLSDLHSEVCAILTSDDLHKLECDNDLGALARVIGAFEHITLELKRAVTFAQVAQLHYTDQSKLRGPIVTFATKLEEINSFQRNAFIKIITNAEAANAAQLQANGDESQELKKLGTLIGMFKKVQTPNLENGSALTLSDYIEATSRLHQSELHGLLQEQRETLFASGLSVVFRYKYDQAVSMGFRDTLEQFAFCHKAPNDLLDKLVGSWEKREEQFLDEFTEMQNVSEGKFYKNSRNEDVLDSTLEPYTWDVAKDIICEAYTRLDARLGKLARRAFDEDWLLATDNPKQHPHVLSGLPVSQSRGAHPFGVVRFSGRTIDVLQLGHEMAHVLSNYIAGEKQGVFTYDASMIVQETFSQFGEALVEHEMMERADTRTKKCCVRLVFTAHELDILTTISMAKLEEELYALMSTRDEGMIATYQEINALSRTHHAAMDKIFGSKTEVRELQFWNIINQPPHTSAVYPISKIMAADLYEEYQGDRETFSTQYYEVMQAGKAISITELWDKLLGKNVAEQEAFIDRHLDNLAAKINALKDEIKAAPAIS